MCQAGAAALGLRPRCGARCPCPKLKPGVGLSQSEFEGRFHRRVRASREIGGDSHLPPRPVKAILSNQTPSAKRRPSPPRARGRDMRRASSLPGGLANRLRLAHFEDLGLEVCGREARHLIVSISSTREHGAMFPMRVGRIFSGHQLQESLPSSEVRLRLHGRPKEQRHCQDRWLRTSQFVTPIGRRARKKSECGQ